MYMFIYTLLLLLQQVDAESDDTSAVASVCGHAGFLSPAYLSGHSLPVFSFDPFALFLLFLTSSQTLD